MDLEETSIDIVDIFATNQNAKKLPNLIVNNIQGLDDNKVTMKIKTFQ
tara:strand:+ start:18501 stop:18644 length:144 start_codon:yes stop_codon:yes gene_type:complete